MNYLDRLPDRLRTKLIKKYAHCAYCNRKLSWHSVSLKSKATLEHIDNDENNIKESNLVLCCNSCNASKGNKPLSDWLVFLQNNDSDISRKRAAIVKRILRRFE